MKNEPFVIERIYSAPIQAVWKAITDKDQMKQWYFDLAEFKPEVGFEFQFEGGKDGRSYLHLCKVTEVILEKKLTYSWRYDGYGGNSFVTFELSEEGSKTKLKLRHEGLETFPIENRDLAKENFAEGWNAIIGTSLKEYLEKDTIKKMITINAAPQDVWEIITDPEKVKQWAKAFGEGTAVKSDWKIGSEVLWTDGEGNIGAKGIVAKFEQAKMLRVVFFDDVASKSPDPTGDYSEIYNLSGKNNTTLLSVEAGILPVKHLKMHTGLWDKAIELMKELAEGVEMNR